MTTTTSIVTISYQDLVKFSREPATGDNDESLRKRLIDDIGRAYGDAGLGILSVEGIPGLQELRQRLLPMAAQIPAMPKEDLAACVVEEACYAVGWSHGKEELTPGIPDLSKGSFYANPLVNDLSKAMLDRHKKRTASVADSSTYEADLKCLVKANPSFFAPNVFPQSMPDLESAISDMGQCIAGVGRLVARVCQSYCQEQGVAVNLEQVLSESLNCKARLLHYFNEKTTAIATSTFTSTTETTPAQSMSSIDDKKDEEQQWACSWHNDHGSLTGLVPAIYLNGSSSDNAHLASSPDPKAGLYIQPRHGDFVKVSLPSGCLGFQIGETFQILSGGLLQATPHAVKQTTIPNVTRETYAVFLEPEYEFPMAIPAGRTVDDCCPHSNKANEALELNDIKSRWKPGINFGEFNTATLQAFHSNGDNKS